MAIFRSYPREDIERNKFHIQLHYLSEQSVGDSAVETLICMQDYQQKTSPSP